jgi:hypothetical protein
MINNCIYNLCYAVGIILALVELHITRPLVGRGPQAYTIAIVATTIVFTLVPVIPIVLLVGAVSASALQTVLTSHVGSDTENSSLSLTKKD